MQNLPKSKRECHYTSLTFPREEIVSNSTVNLCKKPVLGHLAQAPLSLVFLLFDDKNRQQKEMLDSWQACIDIVQQHFSTCNCTPSSGNSESSIQSSSSNCSSSVEQTQGQPLLQVFEFLVRGKTNWLAQKLLNHTLKIRVKDQAKRSRTVPLYCDKTELMTKLDLRSDELVFVLLIDRESQRVLFRTSGTFAAYKYELLTRVIHSHVSQQQTKSTMTSIASAVLPQVPTLHLPPAVQIQAVPRPHVQGQSISSSSSSFASLLQFTQNSTSIPSCYMPGLQQQQGTRKTENQKGSLA